MLLFDLLKLWEPEFSPQQAKVHLARWNQQDNPIDVFIAGGFDEWQAWQNGRNFQRPYVVSLIQARQTTRWLYAGLFQSHGYTEDWEDGKKHYTYQLTRVPSGEEWVGRLYLESVYKQRPSYLNGETLINDLTVVELTPGRLSIGQFPGYKAVDITKEQLDIVVQQNETSWRTALSAVKGIYLISDTATGKLYVGKADGVEGIWGRWTTYSKTAHGHNVALRKEFGIEATNDRQRDLRFSILEIADLHTTPDDLNDRESHWKQILLSRLHGYNRN